MILDCFEIEAPPAQTKIDIEELVKSNLPLMPGSAARISSLFQDINVSSSKLAEVISYDPILTARILRLANSSLYFLQKEVTTLQRAIDVVGMKAVYEIMIIGLAADSFAKEIRDTAQGRLIWKHSLAVALLSRELSQVLGLRGTEEAFICGLLHDIGKILLLQNDFLRFSDVLKEHSENAMLHAENEAFGYNHAQIGSLVAHRWGLPDDVCHTILNHHNPSQSDQLSVVAHLISAADFIANSYGYGLREIDSEYVAENESVIMLNLSPDQMESAWEKSVSNIEEIINSFAA